MYLRILILLLSLSCLCGFILPQNDYKSRQIRAFSNVAPQQVKQHENIDGNNERVETKPIPILNISKINQTKGTVHPKRKQTTTKNDTVKVVYSITRRPKIVSENRRYPPTDMESGAITRGVLVIVVLTVLFFAYLAIKTNCLDKKKIVLFKKYGIRARRNDVEMTPLPLDEDEDDETLFDVGRINR